MSRLGRGTALALASQASLHRAFGKVQVRIMVSIWWIVWAFLIGGYAGMLLVALVVLARKVRAPG
jgi:hypothetical protein